jgi:hypothetical protein
MRFVRKIFRISSLGFLGGLLLAFVVATIGFMAAGVEEPLGKALQLAVTGGYSGDSPDGPWRYGVMVSCALYCVSALPFMLSGIVLVVSSALRRSQSEAPPR